MYKDKRVFRTMKSNEAVAALRKLHDMEIQEDRRIIEYQYSLLKFYREWVELNDGNDDFVTAPKIREHLETALREAIVREDKVEQ